MPSVITRRIWILSLISLFTDMASEMLYPVMPLYLEDIGFKMAFIGFLEGMAELVAGFSKGYFGQLSDTVQKRSVFVRWGYGISAVAKPLLALFKNGWWVLGVRSIERMGKGVRTAARDAMLADESLPENRGKVFGFHRSMDTLGAALGPLIAFVVLSMEPGKYTELFYISALPGAFAVALCFWLKDRKNLITEKKANKVGFADYLNYWKLSSSSYKQVVRGLILFALFNSSDVFLLLILKAKGHSDTWVIGLYILYNIVYAALSYPFGHVADKWGYRKTFILGLCGFIVVYSGIAFIDNSYLLIILFVIYGFYAALTDGISKAWISHHCNPAEKATAYGFYSSFSSFALIISSTLTGLVWDYSLPVYAFVISAIGALGCLVYFSIIGKTDNHLFRNNKSN